MALKPVDHSRGEIFYLFRVRVLFSFRSCHLRLTLGSAPLQDIEKSLGQATEFNILNNMSNGQNLSSTSGEPEFVAQ